MYTFVVTTLFQQSNSTELRKYIRQLKNDSIEFTINWKILKLAKPYSNKTKKCNLCLWEKYFIVCKPKLATLNKKNELVSTCLHKHKFNVNKD